MSANLKGKGTHAIAPKGKQPKRFLEKSDAISLASSIAELQEKKSLIRSEKRQKSPIFDELKNDGKKTSDTKVKLKETKAILRAKNAKAKKERAKSRKERFKGSKGSSETSSTQPFCTRTDKAGRKAVSFA